MMYKAYAGNGDDTTPEDVQEEMKKLAKWLDDEGFVLRTNGNKTGDVFELGSTKFEEYLPWNTFNKKKSKYHDVSEDAKELASRFFPKYKELKESVQKIIGANSHMILGENLRDPVKFLVVWTNDGVEKLENVTFKTGFAAQSIKIASSRKIPVFNLKNPDAIERLKRFVATIKDESSLDF